MQIERRKIQMNKHAAKKFDETFRDKIAKHGKNKWKYFVPTDSHLLGFKQAIDTLETNQSIEDKLGENENKLQEYANEVIQRFDNKNRANNYNNEDFTLSNIQEYGSQSAVVTAKKSSGKLATFFFYYDKEPENKELFRDKEFQIVDISPMSDQTAMVVPQLTTGKKKPMLFIWVSGMGFWCCFPAKEHIIGMKGAIGEERKVEKYNFEKNFREVNKND